MNRRDVLKLGVAASGAMLLPIEKASAGPFSHCTGGIFDPPSPPVTPFVEELRRMAKKEVLPGGAADLALLQNGGVAPNGTVYPQVTGDDALTTYTKSLELIVARQQRNSGNNVQFPPRKFYVLSARQAFHNFHCEMTALTEKKRGSIIWGYDGIYPGPTFMSKYGEPILVRIKNDIFDNPDAYPPPGGFGDARISTHLHNGHTASESDGNPIDIYPPQAPPAYLPEYPSSILNIRFRDHHYPMFRAGLDPTEGSPHQTDGDKAETVCTLWYHDHSMDFTAENVYKGLVGFHLLFDEFDSGNENDPNPGASKLPSGEFDIPLLFQDKRFDSEGQLFLPKPKKKEESPDESELQKAEVAERQDGFLGDRFVVNGQIQPKLTVLRRKYRFRLLNAGPSRFYEFFLVKDGQEIDQDMHHIANDESLLDAPLKVKSVLLSVAERADVIIDFGEYEKGEVLYLVNRLVMRDNGMGPKAEFVTVEGKSKFLRYLTVPAGQGDHILRFEVGDDVLVDPSQIPAKLRDTPNLPKTVEEALAKAIKDHSATPLKELDIHRGDESLKPKDRFTFAFGLEKRDQNIFAINGWGFNSSPAGSAPAGRLETVKLDVPEGEVWTLINKGNWAHPVHIHLEEFQILLRDNKPPPSHEKCKKDVLSLAPNEEVQIFIRFRDFLGKYPIHCHNVIHEDHKMMLRFDVVGDH